MPSKARPPETLTRSREVLAWNLRSRGLQEHAIRDELAKAGLGTVTQQGVSAMLIRTEAKMLAELQKRVGGHKARQTACLMLIYEEAMSAWERSKRSNSRIKKNVVKTETGQLTDAGPMEMVTVEKNGDPAFLSEARGALADVRKIWGLDSPEKYEVKAEKVDDEAGFMSLLSKAMDTMSVEELKSAREHIDALNEIAEKAKGMQGIKDVTPRDGVDFVPGF